jgi:sugar O-acyltransferase (sialic acid O-acetyltransferase NeuD family)
MRDIAIFGAGKFGREVAWLIEDINKNNPKWNFIGYFDDEFDESNKISLDHYLGDTNSLNNWSHSIDLVVAIADPGIKQRIVNKINNPNVLFPVLMHPSVHVRSESVSIGVGSIVCAGCILTVDISVGDHVILNLNCTVGHDSVLGNFSSFMPAVNISGEVTIGNGVYVGTGAQLINQLYVGENTTIGAGAVVSKNLPSDCTAVGVPAKPIKYHNLIKAS